MEVSMEYKILIGMIASVITILLTIYKLIKDGNEELKTELKADIGKIDVKMDNQKAELKADIGKLDTKMDNQKAELKADMDKRFTEMDKRLDIRFMEVDRRFEELDKRLDIRFTEVDKKIDKIDTTTEKIRDRLIDTLLFRGFAESPSKIITSKQ